MKEIEIYLLYDPSIDKFCLGGQYITQKSSGNWRPHGKAWTSKRGFHAFLAQYFNVRKKQWSLEEQWVVYKLTLSGLSTARLFDYMRFVKIKNYEYLPNE